MSEQLVFRRGEGPYHRIRKDLDGVLIAGEQVTLVRWDFPVGREPSPIHSHADHEQFVIMLSGSVVTTLGEEQVTLNAGDIMRIKRNVPHGATVALGTENAVMLDVYWPPREEYVAAAETPPVR